MNCPHCGMPDPKGYENWSLAFEFACGTRHVVRQNKTTQSTACLEITRLKVRLADAAAAIHYPECWDTACYETLESALREIGCNSDCCTHKEGECPT